MTTPDPLPPGRATRPARAIVELLALTAMVGTNAYITVAFPVNRKLRPSMMILLPDFDFLIEVMILPLFQAVLCIAALRMAFGRASRARVRFLYVTGAVLTVAAAGWNLALAIKSWVR